MASPRQSQTPARQKCGCYCYIVNMINIIRVGVLTTSVHARCPLPICFDSIEARLVHAADACTASPPRGAPDSATPGPRVVKRQGTGLQPAGECMGSHRGAWGARDSIGCMGCGVHGVHGVQEGAIGGMGFAACIARELGRNSRLTAGSEKAAHLADLLVQLSQLLLFELELMRRGQGLLLEDDVADLL